MSFLQGAFYMLIGSFFMWLGAFILITAMLPHDFAIKVAEMHGTWVRANVFHLPPLEDEKP